MKELLFGVIGGTALLMYGVDKMGDGLEKASGDTMKKILSLVTGNVFLSFLVGIFITALVQSSTAVTVLTVGFVNSGLLSLTQAIGIIYGANIGTTITAQLMSASFNFNLTDLALPILGVGFAIERIIKNQKGKHIGQAIMGFGMMFLGLKILNSGVPYMEQSVTLRHFFANYATNPLIGIALGAITTALVHSSAATMAIIMILSEAGLLGLEPAIYIILGENLGTCITAQLASQGGNINARRTAWAHTLYNLFGSILAVIFYPVFIRVVNIVTEMMYGNSANISNHLANAHTLFNTINALIFLPLTPIYVRFLERVIQPKEKEEDHSEYLDPLFLDSPAVALEASRKEIARCTGIVKEMLGLSMDLMNNYDEDKLQQVKDLEKEVNNIQKYVTKYIVNLSERQLTDRQSIVIPAMVSSISYIERAADRVYDMAHIFRRQGELESSFSDLAFKEVEELEGKVQEMSDIVIEALNGKIEFNDKIYKLKVDVDRLSQEFQDNHIMRLHEGVCNVDSGVLFIDIMSHLERMANHLFKTYEYASAELIGEKSNQKSKNFAPVEARI